VWLRPRVPVFGTGFPGQEPVQFVACQGFPAVAAARVQVCGQVGQHVQPGHLGSGGGGRPTSSFREPPAFFRATTGPRIARSAVLLVLCGTRYKDNNEAERTIRPVKVQQRSSGGSWRTLEGLADFAIVQSYLSTAAKWGLSKPDALRDLFNGRAWLPPGLEPAG
jgi:hypothetical protein